jgi:hypothetical protein
MFYAFLDYSLELDFDTTPDYNLAKMFFYSFFEKKQIPIDFTLLDWVQLAKRDCREHSTIETTRDHKEQKPSQPVPTYPCYHPERSVSTRPPFDHPWASGAPLVSSRPDMRPLVSNRADAWGWGPIPSTLPAPTAPGPRENREEHHQRSQSSSRLVHSLRQNGAKGGIGRYSRRPYTFLI